MADKLKNVFEREKGIQAKLVLVAVLAVAFCATIYVQFFANREAESVSLQAATVDGTAGSSSRAKETRDQGSNSRDIRSSEMPNRILPPSATGDSFEDAWTPMKLELVVQHDPFAMPPSFPHQLAKRPQPVDESTKATSATAEIEEGLLAARNRLEELRTLGVQVVIRSGDHYFAMINDKVVEVGDKIDGFKVVRIDDEGVHVIKELP